MSQLSRNSWTNLNSDLSKSKQNSTFLLDALNIRIITDDGLSTGAITNRKGNKYSFQIPSYLPFSTTNTEIEESFPAQTVTLVYSPNTTIYYSIGDVITIEKTPGNFVSGTILNITYPPISANIYVYTNIDFSGFTGLSRYNTYSPDVAYKFTDNGGNIVKIPPVSNWSIVGITNIRQDIIIMAVGLGIDSVYYTSIWKCKYNEDTEIIENSLVDGSLTFTNHEVYTRAMNMLPSNKVDIQIHYENNTTGRIYWTDFRNPLRGINVLLGKPNTDLIPLDTIDIIPYFKGDIPILKNIFTGGNIPSGSIQFSYRLLSDDGALTNFSHPSNLIPLSSHTLTESYQDYQGSSQGVNSGKSIEFNIDNIDSNYKFIQIAVILYQFKDVPSITILPLKDIPSNGNFIYSGSEEGETTLTRSEFTAITNPFLTIKGLEQYKNILLAYNTKNPQLEISDSEFDARVYRYKSDLSTYVTFPVDTNADAINPYNLDDSQPYKYKSDGVTLGGTGSKISYEFVTEQTVLDTDYDSTSFVAPFISMQNSDFIQDLEIDNQKYPTNNSYGYTNGGTKNGALKSTYISSLIKGYASGETYRTGIQFFDKRMNPFFVKWIGDIRIPERNETGFNLTNNDVFNKVLYAKNIGIKFTITIPDSLRDRIAGFSIVRVERQQKDKTRLGMGLLHRNSLMTGGSNGIFINPYQDNDATTSPETQYNIAADNFTMEIPNFYFGLDTPFQKGDYLKPIHNYSGVGMTGSNGRIKNESATQIGKYQKYELESAVAFPDNYDVLYRKNVLSSEVLNSTTENLLPSGTEFINMGYDTKVDNSTPFTFGSSGCVTSFLQLDTYPSPGDINGNTKPVMSYNRTISNQYGGNTFSDRTLNTYISCSDFVPIKTFVNNTPFKVFGGDVNICLYDVKKLEHNWTIEQTGFDNGSPSDDSDTRVGITFPCEVSFNLDLRQGRHFAKNSFLPNVINPGTMLYDEYIYNTSYSQENNIKLYFPKPLLTTNLSTGSSNETSNRVWASDKKIDGEQIDSFRRFKPLNFIDVQGSYGQINRIIVHNNNVIYYQDRAMGILSVEYRSLTQDASGASLALGTGKVLERYDYLSTETGTIHQWGVISSRDQLYHYDAYTKKIYITSGQQQLSVSDALNIASLLRNKVDNKLRNQTKSIHNESFTGDKSLETLGISTAFEQEQNTVHFTFTSPIPQFPIPNSQVEKFTISYNETLKGFESRQNFNSPIYHSTEGRILSINPLNKSKIYIQNRGKFGEIYDVTYPLYFKFLINPSPESTKVLDNLIFQLETIDSNGVQINEPFSQIRITNDYQSTGLINIIPFPLSNYNIRRKERTWHYTVPRDIHLDPTSSIKPRIRDKYFIVEIWFNNNNNKQIKIHDVLSSFRNSIS